MSTANSSGLFWGGYHPQASQREASKNITFGTLGARLPTPANSSAVGGLGSGGRSAGWYQFFVPVGTRRLFGADAGGDRWAAASVWIAKPAAPKKMIPISPGNGEVSEKAGSGSQGDGYLGLGKGWLGAGGTLREKNHARRARLEATGCIIATAGGSKN